MSWLTLHKCDIPTNGTSPVYDSFYQRNSTILVLCYVCSQVNLGHHTHWVCFWYFNVLCYVCSQVKLVQHTYSCLFGTFLCNSLREREEERIREKTSSVWSLLKPQNKRFYNYLYCPSSEQVSLPSHYWNLKTRGSTITCTVQAWTVEFAKLLLKPQSMRFYDYLYCPSSVEVSLLSHYWNHKTKGSTVTCIVLALTNPINK